MKNSFKWWLHKSDPRCYWCRVETILKSDKKLSGEMLGRMATLDHIRCRPECRTFQEWHDKENIVLACQKCNAGRNAAFLLNNPQAKAPFIIGSRATPAQRRVYKLSRSTEQAGI